MANINVLLKMQRTFEKRIIFLSESSLICCLTPSINNVNNYINNNNINNNNINNYYTIIPFAQCEVNICGIVCTLLLLLLLIHLSLFIYLFILIITLFYLFIFI